jgi:divalent metal cation (Fe/Co/Zn/Cd) transporter
VLVADALHTRADIFVSLSVVGGLIAISLGYPLADPILALVIALVIAKIGIDIIRESSPTLMDRVAVSPDEVEQIALSVPGVMSSHKARSRGHESAVYADLHIRVDAAMSTEQAHRIAHEVQRRLRQSLTDIQDVTVHVEPADSASERQVQEGIAVHLRRLADGLGLGVHNVWAYGVRGSYYVEAHLEADGSLALRSAHALASSLEEQAYAEIPHLAELTTHIEPYGQLVQASPVELERPQVVQAVRQVVGEMLSDDACQRHGVQVHHVHVHQSDGGWSVSLHCALPGEIPLAEGHRISALLESRLREHVRGLNRVVIHTEPCEESAPAGVLDHEPEPANPARPIHRGHPIQAQQNPSGRRSEQ